MPRFVLLRHTCPRDSLRPSHWDWMFERDGVLVTFACSVLPEGLVHFLPQHKISEQEATSQAGSVIRLADHRKAYLTLEGPLSDNRGSVRRILSGDFEWLAFGPNQMAMQLGPPIGYNVAFSLLAEGETTWNMEFFERSS